MRFSCLFCTLTPSPSLLRGRNQFKTEFDFEAGNKQLDMQAVAQEVQVLKCRAGCGVVCQVEVVTALLEQ